MSVSGWGNYPKHDCREHQFESSAGLAELLHMRGDVIPRGNGRSYGDSALADNVIMMRRHDLILGFDESSGLLHVQAGIMLADILDLFLPRGWFPRVVPGTKLITVGGAIASDVHGKNHHVAGCFSECVQSLRLMLPDGEVTNCGPAENVELFRATCGGMGLTGVILDARLELVKVTSTRISQTTIKTANLAETFDRFEEARKSSYSVAWIDCLAGGEKRGRSILTTGEFETDGDLSRAGRRRLNIPFNMPAFMLNSWSVSAFNTLYYRYSGKHESCGLVELDSFFFPLDAIGHWNRIYGRKGFTQYQFVLPKAVSYDGLSEALSIIEAAGLGSFMAVLKLFGKANNNYLSFPMEGYTLALDFKIQPELFELLDRLDELVLRYGGRHYLAKDARLPVPVFEQSYPGVGAFREIRKKYDMSSTFQSLQSRRLGL